MIYNYFDMRMCISIALALLPAWVCCGGDKSEPVFERGVITAVSNTGRPMDHWLMIQTECCDYTIQNWRKFGGVKMGGSNDVSGTVTPSSVLETR